MKVEDESLLMTYQHDEQIGRRGEKTSQIELSVYNYTYGDRKKWRPVSLI